MSSPYRTQHIFSSKSPESRHTHSDAADTSVNIATAIHNSKRSNNGTSYYASPSNKDTREKTVDVLDIRKIDHEAIRNDPDLKRLSRNPAAFNTSLLDDLEDDEAFYDEEDDSDNDLYAEVELLVNNPEEERRLRTLISQSSTLSNQNVPRTPKRLSSFLTNDDDIDTDINYNQFDFNKKASSFTTTTTANNYSNKNNTSTTKWKEYSKSLFFKALRVCVFQIFMIYWIVKEPIIRIAAFFTMMVSTFFVDPALYVWTKLPNNQNWIPSLERRKQITSICTLIFFISLSIKASSYILPHSPASISKSINYLKSYKSYYQVPQQSNPDLSKLVKSFNSDHTKIWSMIEKLKAEEEMKWSKLQKEQSQLILENKKIWSELGQHQSQFESFINEKSSIWSTLEDQQSQFETEKVKIWSKLEEHQNEINSIKQSIDRDIDGIIGSQLPDMILVQTNKNGELELSPQFYAVLQNSQFWDKFLMQNEESIKKYLAGEMKQLFDQQQKQGAIIGKEAFMKLLSNALLQHGTSKDVDVTLDRLIESAVNKYHQDVLNTADFALESRGARIIHSMTSRTHHPFPPWIQSIRQAAGLSVVNNLPEMAILPQTHAGECWYMYGNQGQLAIALSQPVIVQGITIEYPSPEVMMGKMDNAPKDIELHGILNYPKESEQLVLLGSVKYDINKDAAIQTFDLSLMNPTDVYSAILIKIKSNWGSLEHTDIYRIRIHGIPV